MPKKRNREVEYGKTVQERVERAISAVHFQRGNRVGWEDFGRLLGWSQSVRSIVSRGERPLSVLEVSVIAKRLGVRGGWLAFDEEPMWHSSSAADYIPELAMEKITPASAAKAPRKRGGAAGR